MKKKLYRERYYGDGEKKTKDVNKTTKKGKKKNG